MADDLTQISPPDEEERKVIEPLIAEMIYRLGELRGGEVPGIIIIIGDEKRHTHAHSMGAAAASMICTEAGKAIAKKVEQIDAAARAKML